MWVEAAFFLSVVATLEELDWTPERERLRREMEEAR
jgi:hypothetical protein